MNEKQRQELLSELGRSGGMKTRERHGAEHYKRISALGLKTRKKNQLLRKKKLLS